MAGQISGFFRISSPPGTLQFRPALLNPTYTAGTFKFTIQTQPDKTYTVQFKNTFSDPAWQDLQEIDGTGDLVQVIDDTAAPVTRFYRTRTNTKTIQAAASPVMLAAAGQPLVTEKGIALAVL